MPTLQHLSAEARAVAELGDERRLAHLAEDHWIDYPRAREALQALERLLRCPERTRMPGLLLHGESNIGKSMIIQKFLRAHPAREFNADTGLLQVDVLAVEMPPAPQERRLYGQLLMALNAPYRPSDRLAAVEHLALTLLRKVAPRMIVVDEVHNLLAGTAHEQRASLNLLKFLSNQLRCVIVVLGTRDALAAMQTDPQIASRFPGLELARWQGCRHSGLGPDRAGRGPRRRPRATCAFATVEPTQGSGGGISQDAGGVEAVDELHPLLADG